MKEIQTRYTPEFQLPQNYEFITPKKSPEVIAFLKKQFTGDPIDWFDYLEMETRFASRPDIKLETIGIIEKEKGNIIGAVIACRDPFSHDLWKIPAIAVKKGDTLIDSFQRKGHGQKLMSLMFGTIKSEGGKAVLADTNKLPERGGSREFLEKCGFELIGEIPRYFDGRPEETGLIFIHHL